MRPAMRLKRIVAGLGDGDHVIGELVLAHLGFELGQQGEELRQGLGRGAGLGDDDQASTCERQADAQLGDGGGIDIVHEPEFRVGRVPGRSPDP